MKQKTVFMNSEGDAWYERNKNEMERDHDPVLELMKIYTSQPKSVLEVGCSTGWRLEKIKTTFGCKVQGIDPSYGAIKEAFFNGIFVHYGHAADLTRVASNSIDVLIYGFCLYLCDPEDYFRIIMEGDRVLRDGGHLIIHDFYEFNSVPHRLPYKHKEGLYSHHVRFENLWLAHPWYKLVDMLFRDDQSYAIMKKDSTKAWRDE